MNRNTTDNLYDRLRRAGLRPSAQRIAVLDLIDKSMEHPTADEIYRQLRPAYPTLSLTTIYNTVHALAAAGLVATVSMEKEPVRFDSALYRPHAHFRCDRCGRIYDIPLPADMKGIAPDGFQTFALEVNVRGRCPACTEDSTDK